LVFEPLQKLIHRCDLIL